MQVTVTWCDWCKEEGEAETMELRSAYVRGTVRRFHLCQQCSDAWAAATLDVAVMRFRPLTVPKAVQYEEEKR